MIIKIRSSDLGKLASSNFFFVARVDKELPYYGTQLFAALLTCSPKCAYSKCSSPAPCTAVDIYCMQYSVYVHIDYQSSYTNNDRALSDYPS